MSAPRVSILLPTWNGEQDLSRLLPQLAAQKLEPGAESGFETGFEPRFEIIAIDSDSRDRTRELLAEAGARILRIAHSEFRHGPTRNRAAAEARGDILVFLSQDVVPRDEHFLARLVAAFDDPRTAGAFSRILPHESDDPLTARTVLESPEASSEPCALALDGSEHRGLRFNNVASAIRASVFREIPFPDVAFGEDFAWAALAMRAGWRIRFVPESVALHAHCYSARAAYERYRADAEFHRDVNGRRVRPNAWSALKGFAYEVRQDWRFVRKTRASIAHMARSPFVRGAQVLGQWAGSR
jgi:rhamnosyltransferase